MSDNSYVLHDYKSEQKEFRHPEQWDGLEQFLQETWDNRLRFDVYSDEDKPKSSKQRILFLDRNNMLSTGKYAGAIRYNGLKLDIKPRIFHDNKYDHWKNMLYWLSYCSRIKFPFNKIPVDVKHSDDLLEVLVAIFAKYTLDIIQGQPYSCYEEEECESRVIKGTLLVEKYVLNNIATGRWHKFQIRHKPFSFDNTINRVIKYVSRVLNSISTRSNFELGRIIDCLDEVSDVVCTSDESRRVSINPIFEEYLSIMAMCEMFLDNLLIDTSEDHNHNFSFLLPMDYIYEDFIYGFIDTHIPEFRAEAQKEYWLASVGNKRAFKVRSDIIINEPRLIIDTKYKLRRGKEDKDGVLQADMYQMVSYAVCSGINNLLLLYPYNAGEKGLNTSAEYKVKVNLPGSSQTINIKIASIDIRFKCFNSDSEETERLKSDLKAIIQSQK